MAWLRDLFTERGPGPYAREELLAEMRDYYNLGALGKKIRKELSSDIRTAVRRGILDNAGGKYSLLCRSIANYHPDFLREQFLAAIDRSWVTRAEAIRQASRHLGFRRTGASIEKALRSAINSALRRGELEKNGGNIRRA